MDEFEQTKQTLSNNGYEYIDFLGSGAFSSVFLCRSKQYNDQFAVKQVAKEKLSHHEVNSLISLIHPYIIKLYVTFSDENHQYLVMEYCPKGTITQLKCLDHEKFVFYSKQLLEVLEYCHSQNIAHRDIKPENIFLDQYDHVKLADFGLSSRFQDQQLSNMKCGSLMFSAPEILSNYEFDPFKADIWALGITFYMMVTGHYPFENKKKQNLRDLIANNQIEFPSTKIDPQIQYLIRKMTTKNPLFRPTASQLLKFPLYQQQIGKINKSISLLSSNFGYQRRKSSIPSTFRSEKKSTDSQSEDFNQPNDKQSEEQAKANMKTVRSVRSFNLNVNMLMHNQRFKKYE